MSKKCIRCGRYGQKYIFAENGFEESIIMCVHCSSDSGIDQKAKEYRKQMETQKREEQKILPEESRKIERILQKQMEG